MKIPYQLKVVPAIPPGDRHKIEDALRRLGYHIVGGGQMVDGSWSDISFNNERKGRDKL